MSVCCLLLIIFNVLCVVYKSFALLLFLSLWDKHGGHSLGLLHRVLSVAFWLVEAVQVTDSQEVSMEKTVLGLEIFPWKFWFPRAKQAGTPAYLAASSAVTPLHNSASFPSVLDSLSCTGLYGYRTADLHFHLTVSNIKKIAAVILQAVCFWISKCGSHKVKDHLSETWNRSWWQSFQNICLAWEVFASLILDTVWLSWIKQANWTFTVNYFIINSFILCRAVVISFLSCSFGSAVFGLLLFSGQKLCKQ